MTVTEKKELFKILIQEFREQQMPEVIACDLTLPLDVANIVAVSGPRRSGKSYYFLGLSRSAIYTKALAEYLKEGGQKDTARQLNRVYKRAASCLDDGVALLQAHSSKPEEW